MREYLAAGWGEQDWCMGWPAAPAGFEPGPPRPASGAYPDVPTLVLSGQLDTITTPAEGRMAADQFPNATWVQVTAALHVTALADVDGCASQIVVDFVRLATVGDTSCAARLAPLRAAPPFWTVSAEAAPPSGDGGGGWTSTERVAAAVVATAGDAVARWWQTYESSGLGLRGGTWSARGYLRPTLTLSSYRFATDVSVSGALQWDRVGGAVTGALRVAGPAGLSGTVQVRWDAKQPGALATVTGELGGAPIELRLLAP